MVGILSRLAPHNTLSPWRAVCADPSVCTEHRERDHVTCCQSRTRQKVSTMTKLPLDSPRNPP